MTSVTIEEAQARLPDLIEKLIPGEELVIVQDGAEVAKLAKSGANQWPCQAGSAKDQILWIAPDFDAPLEDFREYME